MIKKTLLSMGAGLTMMAMVAGTALAHNFALSNVTACQPDGSLKITWTVDNKTDSTKDLTITESSEYMVFNDNSKVQLAAAVPAGTKIPAGQEPTYVQTVDGTKAAKITLKITGSYSGEQPQQHQSTATLEEACQQPSTITVKKTTSPTGDPTNFSITISTENGQVIGDATQSIKDGGSVVYKVTNGTYNVTEAAVDGWTQTSNTCKDLVVGPGTETDVWVEDEDQTPTNTDCTIVNTKNTTPVTPPTGGQGGGQVLGATTTQVVAPVGSVNGGEGAASKTTEFVALLGLAGSLGAVGYGVRRLSKSVR